MTSVDEVQLQELTKQHQIQQMELVQPIRRPSQCEQQEYYERPGYHRPSSCTTSVRDNRLYPDYNSDQNINTAPHRIIYPGDNRLNTVDQ